MGDGGLRIDFGVDILYQVRTMTVSGISASFTLVATSNFSLIRERNLRHASHVRCSPVAISLRGKSHSWSTKGVTWNNLDMQRCARSIYARKTKYMVVQGAVTLATAAGNRRLFYSTF
jgi:hypothetical protein